VSKALGLPVWLDAGSTDANIPMSLNIPAIAIDGGGEGSGAHTPDEAFDTANSSLGTQRAVLLAIALAQP
jgi:acetylornithine deacetylase/succinyl-diaminopimelate desuccinylase-like protein